MYCHIARGIDLSIFKGAIGMIEPAFIALLTCWLKISTADTWIRMHALLAGMLTLYPAWRIGKHIGGERNGMTSLLVFSLAPMLIYYSRDAKMYAWIIFFQTTLLYLVLRMAEEENPRPLTMLSYVMFATLLCYTHSLAPLFLGSLGVLFLLFYTRTIKQAILWGSLNLVVILASIPFILMELQHFHSMQTKVFHAPFPNLTSLYTTFGNLLMAYTPDTWVRIAALSLFCFLLLMALLSKNTRRSPLLFILGIALAQILLLFGLSHILPWSLYIDRYIVGAAAPLCIAIATGISAINGKIVRTAFATAWILLCILALHALYEKKLSPNQRDHPGVTPTFDARGAAAIIRAHAEPQDVIWHVYWETHGSLRWYLPGAKNVLLDMGGKLQNNLDMLCTRPLQHFYDLHPIEIEAAASQATRVWLVMLKYGAGPNGPYRGILNWMKSHGALEKEYQFSRPCAPGTLYLFDLSKPPSASSQDAALSMHGLYESFYDPENDTLRFHIGNGNSGNTVLLHGSNDTDTERSIPCECTFSAAMIHANNFQRILGEKSQWQLQLYLAGGTFRNALVKRVSKESNPEDGLKGTVDLNKGSYALYLEHTIAGERYTIPAPVFRCAINEYPLITTKTRSCKTGGWEWSCLGVAAIPASGEHAFLLYAEDPEQRPEAYGVIGRAAFVPWDNNTPPPATPPCEEHTLTLPKHATLSQNFLLPESMKCIDLIIAGPADIAELSWRRNIPQ
ncbi:MAG TPA: glycosyltransferase family 39 protein [Candidatus Hydrogenedentes bacterium]|nr:glycosyltransferase family 39 protein [Candidatus Hydrogenedentota bacterium]